MSGKKNEMAKMVNTSSDFHQDLIMMRQLGRNDDQVCEETEERHIPSRKRPADSDSQGTNEPKKRRIALRNLTNAKENKEKATQHDQNKNANRDGNKSRDNNLNTKPHSVTDLIEPKNRKLPGVPCCMAGLSQDLMTYDCHDRLESDSSQSEPSEENRPEQRTVAQSVCLSERPDEVSEKPRCDTEAKPPRDPHQVSVYAQDIFQYYKAREEPLQLGDYMKKQKNLTSQMRAILVEWLVEIQVNFDLCHETLYLAIKIVDQYLNRVVISRDKLQLVGATALLIACKFEERLQPAVRDFLYICDNAYKRREILAMEREILSSLGFDIGFPLAYRFLRRYAKCASADSKTLALARYILETSLMDYGFTQEKDSMMAAAVFLLAQKMNKDGHWDSTLVYYTGYSEKDLLPLVVRLNTMISKPPYQHLVTIRSKYSLRIFHKVARMEPLSDAVIERLKSNI